MESYSVCSYLSGYFDSTGQLEFVCIVAACIVPMVLHLLYEQTTVYLLLMGIWIILV